LVEKVRFEYSVPSERLVKQGVCNVHDYYNVKAYQIYLYWHMVIQINSPVTKEKVLKAIDKLSKDMPRKTFRKHYGKLKRHINSLDINPT